jgi:virginiamycin B lyase
LIIIVIIIALSATFLLIQTSKTNSNSCSEPTPSPYISEYCVVNKLSAPNAITVDAKGNVWFIAQEEGDLGILYSSNSTMRMFHVPTTGKQGVQSWGIAVDNLRNLVWFTDYADNAIWSFNILKDQFTSHNVTGSSFAFPYQLVLDSKGDVWFTESYANKIGELTPSGQQVQYPLPSQLTNVPDSGPFGLTMSSNGTFWFTDPIANSIGSLSVINGNYTFHVYNMTGLATEPVGIAVDNQGNVWMTQHGPSLISEFNPSSHFFRSITTYIPPYLGDSLPYFTYVDSQGNIWFNEHYGNAIGRFTPANNSLVEYMIPTRVVSAGNISGAITMNLAPDGTPWFTELFAGKIGRVNLQVPINIGISFQNSTVNTDAPLDLSSSHNLTLVLNAMSPSNESVNLGAFLSTYNYSKPFLFSSSNDQNKTTSAFVSSFTKTSGSGNFTSNLTIQDQLLAQGTYYVTISEIASNIHVSKIIQIKVS